MLAEADVLKSLAPAVIPKPARMSLSSDTFKLTEQTEILVQTNSSEAIVVADVLAAKLGLATGLKLRSRCVSSTAGLSGSIVLTLGETQESLGDEGYELVIAPESISLRALKPPGLFYAAQTLAQLLPVERNFSHPPTLPHSRTSAWELPCLRISDQPRFGWRGLLIDCSRTFQSLKTLRRYIDLLAEHKMNVLHLHLTDDQGWRLEIKSHPELTRIGSTCEEKYHERGGYYTQNEVRELIAYAQSRHVNLLPEIEMPGHCLAALKAHPDLSCSGGPFEIYPFFEGPAIQENVFCAGNDQVFHLLEDVLGEVAQLFPSPLIHIGGDEVPKSQWKQCPKCQARIKAENLQDEHALQSYFIRRVSQILAARNRRLLGWDEILEGGLAKGATVMSWRGMEGGMAAMRAGHDVIFSPTSHCYFDYDHEQISLEKVYSFEPVPEGASAEQTARILGVQANMWTHLARTDATLDQQVFPRLAALAEVAWSPKAERNWSDFAPRMSRRDQRLGRLGAR